MERTGVVKLISYFPLLSIVFIVWSNCSYSPSFGGGFYCNDTTIQKPYTGDSISPLQLFTSVLVGPLLIIQVTEKLRKTKEDAKTPETSKPVRWYFKVYFAGFSYVFLVTELLKLYYTELRPHFYYSCLPDVDPIKCSSGLIRNFTCTNEGPTWLVQRDIYKSFPSGHASLSFYAFVFISIYIHKRLLRVKGTKLNLWKVAGPVLCLIWSVIVCVSRLLDNRHFWWDVLGGILIGLLGGLLMVHITINKPPQIQQKTC